ncbi:MAG: hypothetical protein B6I25_06335 [Planctomycetales bacterium 4572_13]|nr:MAG: hypothetical protein B6I25_06335 [Planctomycetales bacterium 4572_13]
MKQMTFILVLTGLCLIGSCSRKSNERKIAEMKHCRKIEFAFNGKYSDATIATITDPNKIERIIAAMRCMNHYDESYVTQILFSTEMRATDRWGRTVTVDYDPGNVVIFFPKGKSRELLVLLKEYAVISSKPALIGSPDSSGDPKFSAYLRAKKHLSGSEDEDVNIRRAVELPGTLGPPVCIVWYKLIPDADKWLIYKSFSSAEVISQILFLLRTDETEVFKKGDLVSFSEAERQANAFKGDQKLSFIYYRPNWDILKIRNMEFALSDNIFAWPGGQSEKLYKMLMEQKEWGNYNKCLDEISRNVQGESKDKPESEDANEPLGSYPFPVSE